MTQVTQGISARVLERKDGEIFGTPEFRMDRIMVDATDSGGGVSLVEHTLAPHVLAAPVHRHSREDEYSFVLEGRLAVLLGEEEVSAEPGDLVFKRRDEWHTFWNPGDTPTRILEVISPAGLEEFFRKLGRAGDEYDASTLPALAARYGCEVDFERTFPIIERHGLTF